MKLIVYQYNDKYIKEVGNHIGYILVDKIEDASFFSEDKPLKIDAPDGVIKKIEFELKKENQSENEYYHNGYYENFKKYNSRDEFINDDGFTDEEKTEICEAIFEAETEREL